MSMAWERTRRRYELTHAVLAEVTRTGRPDIPAGLLGEIDTLYGDLDTFLSDLRRRWYLMFDARLDALLEHSPPDMARAVAGLRRDLDREQPAFRLLFDAHPARTAVDDHHRTTLRAATGVDQPVAHARTRRVS
ncbi:hypothetical protein [Actinophytocola algeriensis]|uniref:Uncharacterized protein n=1 Tax=Actinophytocola algeriensis TaxID=1768010 RepID=A0A7W7VFD2_9PSEU|nr:hypothetical protein [Actinophytocola algeriensis]MBB4908176.1 hypothetical protein [Actinophytocola algeriensis]MBE1480206.1 hypothetical protein [Actinophytocola algeriensis]